MPSQSNFASDSDVSTLLKTEMPEDASVFICWNNIETSGLKLEVLIHITVEIFPKLNRNIFREKKYLT